MTLNIFNVVLLQIQVCIVSLALYLLVLEIDVSLRLRKEVESTPLSNYIFEMEEKFLSTDPVIHYDHLELKLEPGMLDPVSSFPTPNSHVTNIFEDLSTDRGP